MRNFSTIRVALVLLISGQKVTNNRSISEELKARGHLIISTLSFNNQLAKFGD